MNHRITKISFLAMALALVGLIGSTMHYHHVSMHCLEHGDEQHISSNDELCPVCTINFDQPVHSQQVSYHSLDQEEVTLIFSELLITTDLCYYDIGRAPPFMV